MRYGAQAMAVAVLLLLGLPLPSQAAPPQDVFDDEVPPPARPGTGSQLSPAPVAGVSRLRRFQRDRRVVTPSDMRPARPYSGGKPSEPPRPRRSEPEPPAPQPVPVAQLPPSPLPVVTALPWRSGVGQPGSRTRPQDMLDRRTESGTRVAALALPEPPPVPTEPGPVVSEARPAPTGGEPLVATPAVPGTPRARVATGPAATVLEPKPVGPGSRPARSVVESGRDSQPRTARAEPTSGAGAADPRPGPVALDPRLEAEDEIPPPPPALPLRSPRPVAAVVERAPPAPPPALPVPQRDLVVPAAALHVPLLATSAGQPAPASGARLDHGSGGDRGLPAARMVAWSCPVRSWRGRPSSAAASGRSDVSARLSRASAKTLSGVPLPALARPAAGNAPEMAAPVQRVVLSAALQPTVLMPAGPRTALLGLIAPNVSVGRITVSLPLGRHEAKPVVSAMAVVPPLVVVSLRGRMDRQETGPWPLAFPEFDAGPAELALAAEAVLLPRSVAPMGIRRGVLAPESGASGRRRRLPQRFRGMPGASSRGTPQTQPPPEPPSAPPADQVPEPPSPAEPADDSGAQAVPGPSGPAPQMRRRTSGP